MYKSIPFANLPIAIMPKTLTPTYLIPRLMPKIVLQLFSRGHVTSSLLSALKETYKQRKKEHCLLTTDGEVLDQINRRQILGEEFRH